MDIHIADPSVGWERDNLIFSSASKPLWGTTVPFVDEHKTAWPQEDPEPVIFLAMVEWRWGEVLDSRVSIPPPQSRVTFGPWGCSLALWNSAAVII